jgi:hypothetical protein
MSKKIKANKTQLYIDNYNEFDRKYNISNRKLRLSKQSARHRRIDNVFKINLNLKPVGDYSKMAQNFDVTPIEFCKILPYFNFKPIATLDILLNIAIEDKTAFDYVMNNYNDLLFDIYDKVYSKIENSGDKTYVNDTGYISVNKEDVKHMISTLNIVLI